MTTKSLSALLVTLVVLSAFCIAVYMIMTREFRENFVNVRKSRVAIVSVMHQPIDLQVWLRYHRKMGVMRFYIRLEDTPTQVELLKSLEDVWLEIGKKDSSGGNNYFSIMDRQKRFVDACIIDAISKGDVDFIFNIDSDELLFGRLSVLDSLPKEVKCVHLMNAEAVYDGTEETCFSSKRFRRCSLHSKCRSYINGKGGGRAEAKVLQAGPHYFGYDGAIKGSHQRSLKFDDLGVLHFDSCSFAAWSAKFANLTSDPEIPFSYYDESIAAASKAYDVWKKHAVLLEDDDDVIVLEHFGEDGDSDEVPRGSIEFIALDSVINSMQTICINLDKNKNKWVSLKASYMKSDLARANVPLWRFKAILGKQLDVDTIGLLSPDARRKLQETEKNGYRTHHHDLTRGGIGCFLSHWMVYEELIKDESDTEAYLVLEDDVVLTRDFLKRLRDLRVPDDWDIILFGYIRVNASSASDDLLRVYGFWGTHGYLINRRGAAKCIEAFKAEPMDAQIDSKMSLMTRKDLRVYATKVPLVVVSEAFKNVTDIQWPIDETPDSFYYRDVKLL